LVPALLFVHALPWVLLPIGTAMVPTLRLRRACAGHQNQSLSHGAQPKRASANSRKHTCYSIASVLRFRRVDTANIASTWWHQDSSPGAGCMGAAMPSFSRSTEGLAQHIRPVAISNATWMEDALCRRLPVRMLEIR